MAFDFLKKRKDVDLRPRDSDMPIPAKMRGRFLSDVSAPVNITSTTPSSSSASSSGSSSSSGGLFGFFGGSSYDSSSSASSYAPT